MITRLSVIALLYICFTTSAAYTKDKAVSKHLNNIKIGNYLSTSPGGVAFIVSDQAAFAFNTSWGGKPGMAAPDNSIHKVSYQQDGANVQFTWGKDGDSAVIGTLQADKDVTVALKATPTWPKFEAAYKPGKDSTIEGTAKLADGSEVSWALLILSSGAKAEGEGKEVTVQVPLKAGVPIVLAAWVGSNKPAIDGVRIQASLASAEKAYSKKRISASGDWGDFAAAIADNLNNTRLYSTNNKLVAHTVSRGWCPDPDHVVYFCWDSFFNGLLSSNEDPQTGRNTVRAILGHQTEEGLVPNFGNWWWSGMTDSTDRSQPPVGSMCIWKMHQRWPDKEFLAEVYPKLVKWHKWWMTARDGNKNGLLEWGSSTGDLQGALWETGWDDTPAFTGAKMVGHNMDVDAVDLNSLWAMDCEYLALIADAIGKNDEAKQFRAEHETMVKLMNDRLWNDQLGRYCNRKWDGEFITRLTPMCFYPMMAGVPDKAKAERLLSVLTDKTKFWGEWMLPTVAYDDPAWPQQHYWRGKVWGPTNYLTFQGIKRYASPDQIAEYGRRGVKLFMKNWTERGVCSENYLSTDGTPSSDPHYTWGALLNLIGIEALVDWDKNFNPAPRKGISLSDKITIRNVPFGGKLYKVESAGGKISAKPER